jgi:integrase
VSKNHGVSEFSNIATEYIDYPRVKARDSEKQRALSVQELKTLFEGREFFELSRSVADAPLYWLAIIALYTGARPREICQINPQVDFGRQCNDWYIGIDPTTPAGVGVKKTVKTGDARRIPLHPELVQLGLPKYLERIKRDGADRIFPEICLKSGNPFSVLGERFTKLLKNVGLYNNMGSPGNKVLGIYVLRKTFITMARNQRVVSMGITGHADEAWVTKIQAEHYISGAEPFELLVQEISKLSIPVRIPLRDDFL